MDGTYGRDHRVQIEMSDASYPFGEFYSPSSAGMPLSKQVVFRWNDDMRRTSTGREGADRAGSGLRPAAMGQTSGSLPALERTPLPHRVRTNLRLPIENARLRVRRRSERDCRLSPDRRKPCRIPGRFPGVDAA